jgi:CheY-like chemotaxis protein
MEMVSLACTSTTTMPPYLLVIEDDQDVRDTLSEVLRDEGYDVVTAANGQEALDFLHGHPPPRLILLDLMMPVMNGSQFRARQMADARLAQIPTVVLTAVDRGWQGNPLFEKCRTLRKPLDLDLLLTTVKTG